MYKKILYRFFSVQLMAILLLIYALSMGVATFIESIYSTSTAKNLVYESFWFETIMILLIICFIMSIKTYKLFSIKKLPLFIFHISFIIIFIGGAISRYIGFEGMMVIRKGNIENKIISNKTYIKLEISNNNKLIFYRDPYLISNFHNHYHGKFLFDNQIFNVNIEKYIPYAKEIFQKSRNGKKTLKIVSTENGDRIDNFIQSGDIKKIGNVIISFNKFIKNGINILEYKNNLYINPQFNINYFNMNTYKNNIIYKNTFSSIHPRNLYNINGNSIVIPDIINTGILKYISINDENKENYSDVIIAKISTKNKYKKITFLGKKGKINLTDFIFLDGKKISIGYGSIYLYIPFNIRLNDFKLIKYPGSENPSFFSSKISLMEKNNIKNFSIYMNHILHYKGYRFFQSGYDSDGNGTRLSVNHDDYGTYISYIGYLFLVIGMFGTLFWKGTYFNKIHYELKNINKHEV